MHSAAHVPLPAGSCFFIAVLKTPKVGYCRETLADFVKTHVAPAIAGMTYKIDSMCKFLFKAVSQTTLHYRSSKLSVGKAGKVQGGDRLPWTGSHGLDNYEASETIGWQVHLYGEADSALHAWCESHHIPLHVVDWKPGYQMAGVEQGAMYLLRPDMCVALAAS